MESPPVAVFKRRTAKSNLRKRPATPPPQSSSGSEYSSEDESGTRIKRRRKGGIAADSTEVSKLQRNGVALEETHHVADRSAVILVSNDATKQSNWYDEKDDDAESLSAKNLLGTTTRQKQSSEAETPDAPDGTYKGTAAYSSFIQKNPNSASRTVGPVKAPTNIRTITITDFAPDTCKDYKLTGFCGFGDNCKYLHERQVYKQGWALDREWEVQTKGKKLKGTVVASANPDAKAEKEDEEEAALLEKIPFACIICKQSYKHPVVTRCGHYYCEACALQRYKKTPNCAACGAGTGGVFNVAKNLQKLLDKKRIREERLQEEALQGIDSDEE